MRYLLIKRVSTIAVLAVAGYLLGMAQPEMAPHVHDAVAAEKDAAEQENPPAPDFNLENIMKGGKVSLSSYKGKWVFLNFWATWCGPCVVEMPTMNTFYKKMKSEGMEMLAISVDEGDPENVKQFAARMKLDFTILHDPDSSVMRRYGIRSIPRTYVVDPEGNIQAAAEGAREWDNPEMFDFFHGLIRDYNKAKEEAAKTQEGKKVSI